MSGMDKLGYLKRIDDLRKVWPNEARDFTPWLAGHIGFLNEATGLSLELLERESPVGRYSVDLLAQAPDGIAIIENQLEQTNHDHLGKLVTYATGKDAKYIIWIVKSANEEHRAAVEWMNKKAPTVDVYLLELQLWQIDDSVLAPRLEVLVRPNSWEKAQRPDSGTAATYYDFWSDFLKAAFEKSEFKQAFLHAKPSARNYCSFRGGLPGTTLSTVVYSKEKKIGVELVASLEDNSIVGALESHRTELEEIADGELVWHRTERALKIGLRRPVEGLDQAAQFHWMGDALLKLKKALPRCLEP